jgi:predicted metal-dependent phosphoesterase TrpH
MRFELHCHSCYSKGAKIPCEGLAKPEEIIRRGKAIGLSGIAITDHRTAEAWAPARKEAKKQGILFIPGVELQTKEGHLIALGVTEPVNNFLSPEESIERIHEAGGIAVAPHPFDLRGEGLGNLAFKADAVEIFNSMNIDKVSNRFSLSKFKHSKIPKVVGSDAHSLAMIGQSLNIMEANDVDSVLKNILKGNVLFETKYIPMNDIINWARGRLRKSRREVLKYSNSHYSFPRKWLYRKMLKKFMRTSNAPWWVLAQMSLNVSRAYGILKILSY